MRQAGRYMKEYRAVREKNSFLDLCKNSDLASEVTVHAVRRLGVDAAIIFSDLLLILQPMGLELEYTKGDGPAIRNPIGSAKDVERLRVAEPETLSYVYEAIQKTRTALPPDIPLIGFSGAPFTLASYMIEGGSSKDYSRTLAFMQNEPIAWTLLMEKLTASLGGYLNAQIHAGVQAVQIFDSWVGCLKREAYKTSVQPHVRALIKRVTSGIPVIHFGTQTAHLLELMKEAGGDVIGVDWRLPLDEAWSRLGECAVMGNLDPHALLDTLPDIRKQTQAILRQAAGRPGHIFNLGHGVLPQTPVDHAVALVEMVHELSQR